MARSVWKGPFVEESLIKEVDKSKNDPNRKPIKTWSRNSTIIPEFVGHSFLIHNGKSFIPITLGRGVNTIQDIRQFIKKGANKVFRTNWSIKSFYKDAFYF